MELKVEEVKRIEEGKHNGKIVAVEYRNVPFDYTDLVLEFENGKRLKYGVPTSVNIESKLGRLLIQFGASLEVGGTIDPEEVFVGKEVSFMTMNRISKNGTFANVVDGSLKRVEE